MNKSILCSGLLALISAQLASAANCIWTGAGANSNWSNPANWNNCSGAHAIPVDGDALGFQDGTPQLTNNNDLVKLMATQLVIAGGVNLSGNTIGLSAGIVATVPLLATSPVVNLGIVLETNSQAFQCSGVHKALNLGGTINLNDQTLTLDSACSIILTGKITGNGSITKIGASTAFLEGVTSNYTGITTINGGRIRLTSSAGLGASGAGNETVVNDGAALDLEDVSTAEDLGLSGSGISGQGALVGAAGNNTVTGAITLVADSTIGASAGTTLSLDGAIGGLFTLTKTGPGTLRQEGDSTNFELAEEGIVEINGLATAGVGVLSGAILAGSGVITNIVSDEPGATIAPGPSVGSLPGTLGATSLSWKAGGMMAFGLGATSDASDHITLIAALNKVLAGSFTFDFTDASTPPTPGVTYALIGFASQSGFGAGDFDFVYAGTGPGSSMTGTFALTPTELQFTPATVISDLLFRNGVE